MPTNCGSFNRCCLWVATGGVFWAVAFSNVPEPLTHDEVDEPHSDAEPDVAPAATDDVLADLAGARRRRRLVKIDRFEAFFSAYLWGFSGIMATVLLSNIAGDGSLRAPEAAGQLQTFLERGPAIIGLVVAIVVGVGIRSGGKGGPLALDAATVFHVLLSPIDRTRALRGPAFRQLRFGAFAGAAAGLIAGINANNRLPGKPVTWILVMMGIGMVTALAALGAALVMSGLRVKPWLSTLLAVAVACWSGADIYFNCSTSPATFLGQLALGLEQFRVTGFIGLSLLLLPLAGLAVVGRTSLELSLRRASLVGQLRFAATMQDTRSVMLLRRQLAQEKPRSRPWFKLPSAANRPPAPGTLPEYGTTGGSPAGALPDRPKRQPALWSAPIRRSLSGVLRWPAVRLGRLLVLAMVGTACAVFAWSGTSLALVGAGLAAYIIALDAIEPISQDADHPTLRDSYPRPAGQIRVALMSGPIAAMVLLSLIGGLVASLYLRTFGAFVFAFVISFPLAAMAATGAVFSTLSEVGGSKSAGDAGLIPETAGMKTAFKTVFPLLLPCLALIPVYTVSKAPVAGPALMRTLLPLLGVSFLALAWVRYREELSAWMAETQRQAMDQQKERQAQQATERGEKPKVSRSADSPASSSQAGSSRKPQPNQQKSKRQRRR